MTQRDGMGREEGGGFRMGNTCIPVADSFWYLAKLIQLCKVKKKKIEYILCSHRWRSSIQSAKTRPGADCGSDHELLISISKLKLKKVGKTTRPFSYDLNQIPCDNTVEMRNRFKRLNLIHRVPDELWTEVHDIVQEAEIKTIPKKKKCKKAKW